MSDKRHEAELKYWQAMSEFRKRVIDDLKQNRVIVEKSRSDELESVMTLDEHPIGLVRQDDATRIIQELEIEREYYRLLNIKCRKEKRYPSQNEISTLLGGCPVHLEKGNE
jgi:hypothetical protein